MLHYIKIGSGPKVMIGFHGFGRDANMFENYEKVFPDYTIYSISLFYHGSHWRYQDACLSDHRWKAMFNNFLASENISHFSLLGFSLGGKIALYTFQLFSARVEEIHLLASYGIKANVVEWLTQKFPSVYEHLEKYVHHPAFLLSLLHKLRKYKLMNMTLLNIILKQMGSLEARARAFHSMLLYGKLRLDLEYIKMKMMSVPVTFYLGHNDQVLTFEALRKYISGLKNYSLHVLPAGHGMLPEMVAQTFSRQQDRMPSHIKQAVFEHQKSTILIDDEQNINRFSMEEIRLG